MILAQRFIVLVIVVATLLIMVVPGLLFANAGETSLLYVWSACCALSLLSVMVSCFHVLRPDRMIVSVFLGDVYKVHARQGKSRGIAGTGIVWIFPPLLNRAVYLPVTVFTVPFQSSSGNTQKTENEPLTPVTVFLHLQLRIKPSVEGVRAFLEAIPVLNDHYDLTTTYLLQFCDGIDSNGRAIFEERNCPHIASILVHQLAPAVGEAVARTIAEFPLSSALANIKAIKDRMRTHFQNTVFTQAHLLKDTGDIGDALSLFDFNITAIVPTNRAMVDSLSAEAAAQYSARGVVATAEGQRTARKLAGAGEAEYLEQIEERAKTPEGKIAIAATALEKLPPSTTLIATPDIATAIAAKLVSQTNPKSQEETDSETP